MEHVTPTTTSSRWRARTRGQVLVLGCISLLVMALMLSASFGVSNALYERIRIQSHADAQAYSLATVEARAFNLTAHYNRAIAANLVAQMSLHSWMAIATADVAMLNSGAMALIAVVVPFEVMLGCYPYNFSHCPCVIMAMIDAFRLMGTASEWSNTLQGLESSFNDGVDSLKQMADELYKSQKSVLSSANQELGGGSVMQQLKQIEAPRSQYLDFNGMNQGAFQCALEGADDLDGKNCSNEKAEAEKRSNVMQNVANAARPTFDTTGASASLVSDDNFNGPEGAKVPKDDLNSGTWTHFFKSSAGLGAGHSPPGGGTDKGESVGAEAIGGVLILNYRDTPAAPMVIEAKAYSDKDGGDHSAMPWAVGHDGQHDKFKGVVMDDPCGESNCFVNFRADSSADHDYGQPTVYGGASQDLRIYKTKSGFSDRPPWEINSNRKVKLKLSTDADAEIDYLARNGGTGYAVAKAKTYFHQLGTWKSPPNFFDPFWRAKLHPFTDRQELSNVLGKANDSNGKELMGKGAPVEGAEQ